MTRTSVEKRQYMISGNDGNATIIAAAVFALTLGVTACDSVLPSAADQRDQEVQEDTVWLVASDAAPHLELSVVWYKTAGNCDDESTVCYISGRVEVTNAADQPATWSLAKVDPFHFFLSDDQGERVNSVFHSGPAPGRFELMAGQDTLLFGEEPNMHLSMGGAPAGYYDLKVVVPLRVPDGMEGEYGEAVLDLGQIYWPFVPDVYWPSGGDGGG